jgi:hypothetical protein
MSWWCPLNPNCCGHTVLASLVTHYSHLCTHMLPTAAVPELTHLLPWLLRCLLLNKNVNLYTAHERFPSLRETCAPAIYIGCAPLMCSLHALPPFPPHTLADLQITVSTHTGPQP